LKFAITARDGKGLRFSSAINKEAFYANYKGAFTLVEADTQELREQCFKLRYEVFCLENGYEDPARNTDQMECDTYDLDAVHFLLMHNDSGRAAGTVRVILPQADRQFDSFPVQNLCDHPILHTAGRPMQICQISRLCMSDFFRRRDRDGRVLPAYYEQENLKGKKEGNMIYVRRRIPYAPLGLFQMAFEAALSRGIMDCVMFIEPDQLAGFKRMGIAYSVLGPRLDHHGGQQPVIFNIKHVLDTMLIDNPQCWDVVSDMGRLHKMANNHYLDHWQDAIMDDLCWDAIEKKLS